MKKHILCLGGAMLACAFVSTAFAATAAATDGPDPDRYIVKFSNAGQGKAAVAAAGASVVLDLPQANAAAVRIPAHALEALQRNPNIEYIEADLPRYPMAQTTPYGIPMVEADQVSDAGAGNRTVCIIDSGYSLGHEDLPSGNTVSGTNDSGTGNWFVDGCAHGTHVAGTVAALTNNVGVVGVLPNENINLHIIKVFGDSCAWTYSSNLVHALNQCQNAGADVVSMSLGCSGNFCRSTTEENAFNNAFDAGLLSVAAAGNDGNTQSSYPASYDSVISVAAVDSAKAAADFSQRNSQVELSAPGVAVRSTVPMGAGTEESLSVSGTGYEVVGMDGSPNATGSGPLFDCGLGTSACPGGGGQVCLIERGDITFADKVLNCQAGGGVAAVIYNNEEALFSGTLGGTSTSIPSVGASGTTGSVLLGQLGQSASVTTGPGNYSFFDGTSMATPHVSAVAALVWSYDSSWSNQQIRDALAVTAEDLGAAGRDNTYGWGLIRAKAALDFLQDGGGEPPPPDDGTMSVASIDLSVRARGPWRNGVAVVTVVDDGGNPVANATVSGSFSGDVSGSASGTTDSNGQVGLESDRVRQSSISFTFCVDSASHADLDYEPGDNVETCDSL